MGDEGAGKEGGMRGRGRDIYGRKRGAGRENRDTGRERESESGCVLRERERERERGSEREIDRGERERRPDRESRARACIWMTGWRADEKTRISAGSDSDYLVPG